MSSSEIFPDVHFNPKKRCVLVRRLKTRPGVTLSPASDPPEAVSVEDVEMREDLSLVVFNPSKKRKEQQPRSPDMKRELRAKCWTDGETRTSCALCVT